jgi:hypothetical protein
MALNFNPPKELVDAYLNRPSPGQIAGEGIQNALQLYVRQKALQDETKNRQQQTDILRQKEAREGRQQFYDYGDTESLSPEVQASLGKPAQGPANYLPPEQVPYGTQQQGVLGGAQGPVQPTGALQQPQLPSLIERYNQFLKDNPEGLKGQQFTEDTVLTKDEKGNITGQSTYKRPVKGRTILSGSGYQAQRMFTPQKTDLTDANGNPLQFTPNKGYEPAPVLGGGKPVPRKGDESAIQDVTLMSQQLPNVKKLIDGYKSKSMLGSERLGIAAQSTPAGYLLDPDLKQIENSMKLAAFTFGGKNLTGQEKEIVYGGMFPHPGDKDSTLDLKEKILSDFFSEKIDLLQAANLLGPAGAPMRQMLESKMNQGQPQPTGTPVQQTGMEHLSDEELQRIINGGH